MRIATICKAFTFHAAHRLPNHNGPCRDLHGHTYKLEVSVTGKLQTAAQAPDEGMVIDFQQLKDIYREEIEPLVEHKFLNETLEHMVPYTLAPNNEATPLTTCENIAMWIWRVFNTILVKEYQAIDDVRITLWETPTSYARVPADREGLDNK